MSTLRVDNIKSRTGSIVTIPDSHTLAVTGISSIGGNQTIAGTQSVGGTQTVTGTQTVGGTQTVSGNQSVSGYQNVTGVSTVGSQTVNGTQTITGAQTVGGTQSIAGNATITGSLNISGGGSIINTTGVATVGTLNVTGATSWTDIIAGVSTDLTITRNLSFAGVTTLTGNTIIGGDLTVNGTQTTVNTATLSVADNQIDLRTGNNVTAGDGGVRVVLTTDASGSVQTSRAIRWNNTSGKWEFTEDGSTYKKIGSGDFALSYFAGSFN